MNNLTGSSALKTKIGIIGAGQLGMMMIDAGRKIGNYHFTVLDKDIKACAVAKADKFIHGEYDNVQCLTQLFEQCDHITYEFENVPASTLYAIEKSTCKTLTPAIKILEISQHRIIEKKRLESAGFNTAPFASVDNASDLIAGIKKLGLPCILKTCSGGYDGKGQWSINKESDISKIKLSPTTNYILEKKIFFEIEVSCIVFRSSADKTLIQHLPISENIHHNGILHISIAPARIDKKISDRIIEISKALMLHWNLYGTLAIEFFITKEKEILINEIAPRPHNSGHFSMNACTHSQFDMHIKAVSNAPLPEPILQKPTVMLNILGKHAEIVSKYKFKTQQYLHWYGKDGMKQNRKVGHINFCGQEIKDLYQQAIQFYEL